MRNGHFLSFISLARQRGFSIVTAIFILVAFSIMAVVLLSLFTVQRQVLGLDVQGARAYQAARAGIEWGLYQQLRIANPVCNNTVSFAMPAGTSLSTYSVTVSCVQVINNGLTRKQLTSIACNQPDAGNVCPPTGAITSPDYVQRKVQVEL
ncbi:MAG: agglutinin biogenesis protein MshP [Burkholderiales bacterium]|nr:agglutinin biogenesis protein MshP [Burkholderiales bacterium]